jgi:hypothetical protein
MFLCRRGYCPRQCILTAYRCKIACSCRLMSRWWRFEGFILAVGSRRSGGNGYFKSRSFRAAAAWSKLIQPLPSLFLASWCKSGHGSSRIVTSPLETGRPILMSRITSEVRVRRYSGVMPVAPCGTRPVVYHFCRHRRLGRCRSCPQDQSERIKPTSLGTQPTAAPQFVSRQSKPAPNAGITSRGTGARCNHREIAPGTDR